MHSAELDLSQQMLNRILVEYARADDQLGKEFHIVARGNNEVARKALLLMAEVHLFGAKQLMDFAGLTSAQIAEQLYRHADDEAVDP